MLIANVITALCADPQIFYELAGIQANTLDLNLGLAVKSDTNTNNLLEGIGYGLTFPTRVSEVQSATP